jgi:hypothetical protein
LKKPPAECAHRGIRQSSCGNIGKHNLSRKTRRVNQGREERVKVGSSATTQRPVASCSASPELHSRNPGGLHHRTREPQKTAVGSPLLRTG